MVFFYINILNFSDRYRLNRQYNTKLIENLKPELFKIIYPLLLQRPKKRIIAL
jgi:hypothetical protein